MAQPKQFRRAWVGCLLLCFSATLAKAQPPQTESIKNAENLELTLEQVFLENWEAFLESAEPCHFEIRVFRSYIELEKDRRAFDWPGFVQAVLVHSKSGKEWDAKAIADLRDLLPQEEQSRLFRQLRLKVWHQDQQSRVGKYDDNGNLVEDIAFATQGVATWRSSGKQIQVDLSRSIERWPLSDLLAIPRFRSQESFRAKTHDSGDRLDWLGIPEAPNGDFVIHWQSGGESWEALVKENGMVTTSNRTRPDGRRSCRFTFGELPIPHQDIRRPAGYLKVDFDLDGLPDFVSLVLVDAFQLNCPLKEHAFTIPAPAGTPILDLRGGMNSPRMGIPVIDEPCVFSYIRKQQENSGKAEQAERNEGNPGSELPGNDGGNVRNRTRPSVLNPGLTLQLDVGDSVRLSPWANLVLVCITAGISTWLSTSVSGSRRNFF